MSLDQDTAELPGTALAAGELLPSVTFTDARTGGDWRPSQLRQRSGLVLCFAHDRCAACQQLLADLAERQEDIDWADTQVRVVLSEPADAPFPVLVDPEGRARSRMLGPDAQLPTLVVADRYTAVVEAFPAPEHGTPEPEEIVSLLRLVACDCS